jgi:L-ascorbate metabolism protein UlaG (beta-lactamase superfamily)
MTLNRNLSFSLGPRSALGSIPFATVLYEWKRRDFAPVPCRDVLLELVERYHVPDWAFDPSAVVEGRRVATERLLYPEAQDWRLLVEDVSSKPAFRAGFDFEASEAQAVGEYLLDLLERERPSDDPDDPLGAEAQRALFLAPGGAATLAPRWPEARRPGIYRREHASLLVRSETTTILVDPISLLSEKLPGLSACPRATADEPLDAILVTHHHADHWHLPSVLHHATEGRTKVVVPAVPRINLLCDERFAESATAVGLDAIEGQWEQHLHIGDIEVYVLPFYGEQPTRDEAGVTPDLRSWGNTYRITTPQLSVIVIADAGTDPQGSMEEVFARSYGVRGPVDFVASSSRELHCPFFGGLHHYWAALPFAELTRLWNERGERGVPSTTAGVEGIARLCGIAGARSYLPYANGFAGVGRPIADVGWGLGEASEPALLEALSVCMSTQRTRTDIMPWVPGEGVVVEGPGRFAHVRSA